MELVCKPANLLMANFLDNPFGDREDDDLTTGERHLKEARQLTKAAALEGDEAALYDLCKAVNLDLLKGFSVTATANKFGLKTTAVSQIKTLVQAQLASRLLELNRQDVVFDLYQYLVLYREEALRISSAYNISGASRVMAVNAGVNASKVLLELCIQAGIMDKKDEAVLDPRLSFLQNIHIEAPTSNE